MSVQNGKIPTFRSEGYSDNLHPVFVAILGSDVKLAFKSDVVFPQAEDLHDTTAMSCGYIGLTIWMLRVGSGKYCIT